MGYYDSFVKEAIKGYGTLPEETNELYRRHHLELIEKINTSQEIDDATIVKKFINANEQQMGIKFDAIIGSGSAVVDNEKGMALTTLEGAEANLKEMLHTNNEDKYAAFINANSRRVLTIDVLKNAAREINILFLNSETPLISHVLIDTKEGSHTKIVEVYASSSSSKSAMATIHEIRSGDNSTVELDAIHNENANTTLLSFCRNILGKDSKFKFNTFYNGSVLTRVRNVITASEKSSSIDVNEVVLGATSQRFDIATQILNQGRESHANLDSKAVLMDSSFCLLKGFAKVLKGAAGSRSYIHERGILLDKGAHIDGLPDMSVDESEVKATHSSATAPVDPESVFYLMSKGIPEIGVRKLIVSGFLGESIAKMHNNEARNLAIELINHKLETREFGALPKPNPENEWMFGKEKEKDMFMGHYKYR